MTDNKLNSGFQMSDPSYLHKKMKYFSDERKFEYLCKYVKHVKHVLQEGEKLKYIDENYIFILGYISDNLMSFDPKYDKFNYDEIRSDTREILQLINVSVDDVCDDMPFMK